jgi:hypothetical protein
MESQHESLTSEEHHCRSMQVFDLIDTWLFLLVVFGDNDPLSQKGPKLLGRAMNSGKVISLMNIKCKIVLTLYVL